ncbi:MAG TPA: GNAT family N-acetyltransferase [Burkholderiaceae bacterium]|nr:GNAT family N-acetyltransferase [Burkholderiaceae bacterium]
MNALFTDAVLGDQVEAEASADLYAAAPAPLARELGLQVRQVAGATALVARALPDPMLNRVIALGVERPATEPDLDALIEVFDAARVARYWIHLNPIAQPQALGEWLAARGFAPARRRSWAKLICHTVPVLPMRTDLSIRRARGGEAAAATAAIRAAYGLPDPMQPWIEALVGRERWITFVAADGDRIVGGGMLYLDLPRKAGWLGLGGVRAEYRGRGAQRALIAARVQAALEHGCDVAISETGEPIADEPNPSLQNLLRCGFARVVSRVNYAAPPSEPAAG